MGSNSKRFLALLFAAMVIFFLFVLTTIAFFNAKGVAHEISSIIGAIILCWVEIEVIAALLTKKTGGK